MSSSSRRGVGFLAVLTLAVCLAATPALADLDGDGVEDAVDNCVQEPNPNQANGDGDPLGDACDPYPDLALRVEPTVSPYGLTDRPVRVLYQLFDQYGVLRSDLEYMRATLTLSGSAVFGTTAIEGILYSGGGGNRALAEFVAGRFAIDVVDTAPEPVTLGLDDTEGAGLSATRSMNETFESGSAGFTHYGYYDQWQYGTPASGPGAAFSGTNLWATNLAGNYYLISESYLLSPWYDLSGGGQPRLEYRSWFHGGIYDGGFTQVSTDGWNWYDVDYLEGDRSGAGFELRTADLAPWAGQVIQLRFRFNGFSEPLPGWYIDDVALRDLSAGMRFLLPDGDDDYDGIPNAEELLRGSDPLRADTDGDGYWDGFDNCPTVPNPDQADADGDGRGDACGDSDGDGRPDSADNCAAVANPDQSNADADRHGDACDNCPQIANDDQADAVHPGNGFGDACDDPDGDGFADSADHCPDLATTGNPDRDGDGLGDDCDPFPDGALVVRVIPPPYGVLSQPTRVAFELRNSLGGIEDGFQGARVTVTIDGSAVFLEHAVEGLILEGGGTQRALIEFVAGRVVLDVLDGVEEAVHLAVEDTERQAIGLDRVFVDTFDALEESFTHAPSWAGAADPWVRGVSIDGPPALTAPNMWYVAPDPVAGGGHDGRLISPPLVLAPDGISRLRFQSGRASSWWTSAGIEISLDDGVSWLWIADVPSATPWTPIEIDLGAWRGQTLRFSFRHNKQSGPVSWNVPWSIDSASVDDVLPRPILFLDGTADPDGDGLASAVEIQLGTDPTRADSDLDGVPDDEDNCPRAANPDQEDRVHPNGVGDACDDPDGDLVADRRDACPDVSDPQQLDSDRDLLADACDNCPFVPNPDQSDRVHPNGVGDACDDPDGDGTVDGEDLCPDDPEASASDYDEDGVGDACDPYPTAALRLETLATATGLAGVPSEIEWRLVDRDGYPRTDLDGVRAVLSLSGGAVFGEVALAGRLVEGGETSRAVVEVVDALVRLSVQDASPERVTLDGADVDRVGISFGGLLKADFDASDDGFTSEPAWQGALDAWRREAPVAGPGSAYSAPLSWVATRRAAVPGAWTYGRLVFPAVTLPSAAFARLSFRTWLSHDSWWHDRDATVVVSPDGTSWWVEVDQVQRSDGARWELDEVDLSAWANQTVRLGLTLNMGTDTSESTWLVDGVSIATASAWIDFLDPAADPDGDGIDSRTELGLGSLPLRADTDGDGVGDGADNCPIAVNPGQEDRVRPNGIGDACDDPDGDGFPDLSDLCPDQWAATNGDSDGDGVGDACDAHGDLALLATGQVPSVAPLGADVTTVWRLVDQDGRFRPDLEGVRVTLLAGEGARFGETATRGRIIAGGGSSTVLVEFVEGLVELPLIGEAASTADLSGADTENLGIAVAFERLLRFDTDDGGLTHAPLNSAVDPWRWGPPPSGPAGAYSPPNCWGAADDGYSTRREGELRISSIVLPDAATALRFRSFYLRGYFDDATIELSSDGGATWSRLAIAADSGNAWREERIPLAAYRGRKVSIRFRLRDDSHSVTWYIDDLRFLERRATVRFVDPDADLDGDGISNGDEFEAGSDPTVPDGDADGVPDGADNCPLAPNADQADSMHPGGGGDACDDPDGDGLPDALDLCPDAYAPANSDRDGDRHGDACDPRPDIALRVELETSAYLLVGRPANATFRLIDQYGDVRTDLSGLRFGLRLSPGASFEGPVARGVLIEGEGTSAVTVEFEDGVVELSILAPAETEYELWGEDVAGEGVAERFEWRTSFDNGNDGMTHASLDTTPDPWRRGTPTVGPGAAVSPPNAWSTALGAPPTVHANAYLATPDLALPLAQPARIEFWSWASPLPAYPSTRAYLEVSDDGGANWEALPALVRGAQQWVKESVDLSTWSGSTVRIRFHVNSGYAYVPVSWYLDDLSIVVGVYRLRSRDAASDPDSDGVDNEHELLRGSDPESADTDRDGVADGIDNCPSVSNEAQRDVVHPGAGGDACDDPDGDGLADESDFCPDLPIPETKDSDFDGLGNACDPYPDLALHAVPRLPEAAIVGAPARVTWELRDRDGGFHPELLGVRAELRLSGSAVFGETALAGRLLEGGGTARVLVEFVDGLVALEVGDGTAENVVLDLVDLDGIGIAARGTYLESFDAGPGGFVHEPIEPGALDLWALGPGPGGTPCYTAPSCWRSIDDAGFGTVAGALVSPVLRVTPGIETLLRFVSIKEPYHGRTAIEASVDGSPWFEIGGDPGSSAWQEAVHRIWYGPRRTIRFRFTHESIPGEAVPSHWAIDEFRLEGSVPTLLFLEGAADRDGDGISNAEELLVGGSTGRLDGDEDGFDDPRDNCPGISNHDQYDAIVPGGPGDLCGDADGDGAVDAADPCPDQPGVDGTNADGDRLADACDPYPQDALFVLVDSPRRALAGGSIAVSLRLVDEQRVTRGDLHGVRVALTAHGPAVFGQAASAGVLHEGGGTARVVLEFVDGAAGIDLVGAGPGEVALRYEDIQRLGLELLAEERRDFESSPGYLVSGPPEAPWEWGAPSGGPRSASSGRRVWGTSLDGVTPSEQDDQWLETPPLRFASRPGPRVEFQHWIESVANGLSARFCAVRGEEELVRLDQFVAPTDAWVPYRKQLALDHLRPVRLLFWWESEGLATAVNGWYVDDLVISGLEKTVSFLDPTADDDGDGLSNANELARGSDPDNQDSDRDGVADGSDNCPVIVNPDQADLVTPNGIGDVCDDGDGDGWADATDPCPAAFDALPLDFDLDSFGDACDNCPHLHNLDQADADGDGTGDACEADAGVPGPSHAPFRVPYYVTGYIVDPVRPLLYGIAPEKSAVVIFDLGTGLVAREFELPGTPRALALSPDGSTLFAAHEVDEWPGSFEVPSPRGMVARIDIDSRTRTALMGLPFSPSGVVATRELDLVVASDSYHARLDVLDGATGERLGRLPVQAAGLALHPADDAVYTSASSGSHWLRLLPGGRLEPGGDFDWTEDALFVDPDGGYLLGSSGRVALLDPLGHGVTAEGERLMEDWLGLVSFDRPHRSFFASGDYYSDSVFAFNQVSRLEFSRERISGYVLGLGVSGETLFLVYSSWYGNPWITTLPHPSLGGATNGCPVARLSASPGPPYTTNDTIVFDATASTDPDDGPEDLRYRFDLESDGTWDSVWSRSPVLSHRFEIAGSRTVRVQAMDRLGLESIAQVVVDVVFAEDPGSPVTGTTPFLLPFRVFSALVDAGRRVMWTIDASRQRLDVIDLATGAIATEFTFTEGRAESMALSPDRKRLAVALSIPDPTSYSYVPVRYDLGQLAIFDAERPAKIAHYLTPFAPQQAVLTDGSLAVVRGLTASDYLLATVDALSGIERARVVVAEAFNGGHLALHASQRRIYLAGVGEPRLRRFELLADGTLDETPLAVQPQGGSPPIWVDTLGTRLLSSTRKVYVTVDDPQHDLEQETSIGQSYIGVQRAVFDDARRALLIEGDGVLEFYNTASLQPIGGPSQLTWWEKLAGVTDDAIYTVIDVDGGTRIASMPHPIRDGGANGQPAAAFTVEAPTFEPGALVTFDASSSDDPNDGLAGLRFRWDLDGDGSWDTQLLPDPVIRYRYADAGSRVVRLQARDRLGLESTASRRVDIPVPDSQRFGGPTVPLFAIRAAAADAAFETKRPVVWVADPASHRVVATALETGLLVREVRFEGGLPERLALSPDGELLAVSLPKSAAERESTAGAVAVIDAPSGAVLASIALTFDPRDVAVSNDGRVFVVGEVPFRQYLAVYDAGSGHELSRLEFTYYNRELVLHPGGRYGYLHRYGYGGPELQRFDVDESGSLHRTSSRDPDPHVQAGVWIDPSGEFLLIGSSRIFDLAAESARDLVPRPYLAADYLFTAAAWDDRNKELYTASGDRLTRYDEAGRLQLESVPGPANVLALGRYGRRTYVAYKDGTRTLVSALDVNHSPVADAGPDQVVECDGTGAVPVTLDGARSDDYDSRPGTKDDILLYAWQEGGTALASGEAPTATVPLAPGRHDLTLTVTDQLRATDDDVLTVDVRDTLPPEVTITAPAPLACFGPAAAPVTVEATAADRCATASDLTYDPPGGPSYDRHGDYAVTVTASDPSGNSGSSSVPFTIDLIPPTVRLIEPPGGWVIPRNAPFGFSFTSADDDGAAGGPVHELVTLDACLLFDGNTFGDRDGLLTDETLLFDDAAICAAIARCGVSKWVDPRLAVEVQDCGGNVARATKTLRGTITPNPSLCAPRRPRGLQPDLR